jgi:selenocysteine lyase/cysteine desulfurase
MTATAFERTSQIATTGEIRAHFPALDRIYNGCDVAYFDAPGGTQVPRAVADAMVDYLYHRNANTDWAYPTSAETDAALASARLAFADFLNASPDEIVFGANMTTLTFHLSRAIGRGLAAGDEIIVTELDHHANVDPWREMARERSITVRTVRMVAETGQLDWDDFDRQLRLLTPSLPARSMGFAAFAIESMPSKTVADRLRERHRINVQSKAERPYKPFAEAVRVTPQPYTTLRELDRFVGAVISLATA